MPMKSILPRTMMTQDLNRK